APWALRIAPSPRTSMAGKNSRTSASSAPVVALYERLARPIATPQTPGAFRFGLRLMAIDGTVEDVPDTPANAAAFGRQHGSRGDSAFPQVQLSTVALPFTNPPGDPGDMTVEGFGTPVLRMRQCAGSGSPAAAR